MAELIGARIRRRRGAADRIRYREGRAAFVEKRAPRFTGR